MQNQQLKWKQQALDAYAALPRRISNKDIVKATKLSASWLTEFVNGKIKEPSVDKVETLLRYCENIK